MAEDGLDLGRIAELAGGRVVGDPGHRIGGMASLDTATADDMALLADPVYLDGVGASAAGALLVAESLESRMEDDRPRVVVADPHAAMIPILQRFDPTPVHPEGVHRTAVVEPGAELGDDVSVGPYAILESGASIGSGTRVGAHCVIGRNARVGRNVLLHPHVVLYANVEMGDRVIVHSGARIGVDGFGYAFTDGRFRKIPQVGRCRIGDDVEIGANTCVDRGSIGVTEVEEGVKMDNLVHVGHNVTLGRHGAYAGMVGIAGSTRIGAYARFGGQSGVVGHLELPAQLAVAAGSKVLQAVGEPGDTIMGYPAGDQRETARMWAALRRLPELLKRVRELERAASDRGNATGSEG